MEKIELKEAFKILNDLGYRIEMKVRLFDYEAENVQYNHQDANDCFLHDQLKGIIEKLNDVQHDIAYLQRPICAQGIITHNDDGRYELPTGDYFTSGSTCEILTYDDLQERNEWVFTSIEHNGNDYYATALGKDISIDGMMLRVRR